MLMNTRSGAHPDAPAVASKATKTTQAIKASRAKSKLSKANANRIQKPAQQPAPTRRNARDYVRIDVDSHTVDNDNDTSRTANPDYVPDTPTPPPRRVTPETPPLSSQAELEAEVAGLHIQLRHHRH